MGDLCIGVRSVAKEGNVLEQKNYCSPTCEPLRGLKRVVLYNLYNFFPTSAPLAAHPTVHSILVFVFPSKRHCLLRLYLRAIFNTADSPIQNVTSYHPINILLLSLTKPKRAREFSRIHFERQLDVQTIINCSFNVTEN